MILIELLWIVFGVGYVVLKMLKEEQRATLAGIKMFFGFVLFFLLPIGTISYVAQSDSVSETTSMVFSVLGILYFVGVIAWFLWWLYSPKSKERAEKKTVRLMESKKEKLRQEFHDAGYRIKDEYIAMLVDDISSPLHTASQLKIPLADLYKWLCNKRERYYERMAKEEFDILLGTKLEDIPLNPQKARIDAMNQRKCLAIKYLIATDGSGLSFDYSFKPWMSDDTDYPRRVVEYIEQKRNMRDTS